jgi:hypothetical protein
VISREEVLRTAQNIGYITYKLADVVGYDLTIVEGLRWLQRCIQYIARSYDLFDTDYTAQLSAYESVVDGDSDE